MDQFVDDLDAHEAALAEVIAAQMLDTVLDSDAIVSALDSTGRKIRELLHKHPLAAEYLSPDSRENIEDFTDELSACASLILGVVDQWKLRDVHVLTIFARADSPEGQEDLELGLSKVIHDLAKTAGLQFGVDRNEQPAIILAAIARVKSVIGWAEPVDE